MVYFGCGCMQAYKCFNKGLINSYGTKYEVGKLYYAEGQITFGVTGNGFHVCENLEDTLRFFDAFNEEIDICLVNCFGKYDKRDDEYNGYFSMYCFEYLRILKVLTREEIINYGLNLDENRVVRFISSFKLTKDEENLFREKFSNCWNVINHINYYQENDKDSFKRKLEL